MVPALRIVFAAVAPRSTVKLKFPLSVSDAVEANRSSAPIGPILVSAPALVRFSTFAPAPSRAQSPATGTVVSQFPVDPHRVVNEPPSQVIVAAMAQAVKARTQTTSRSARYIDGIPPMRNPILRGKPD